MTNAPVPAAIHSVDEFVIGVPDLNEARHFFSHFGLEVREEGQALGLYTRGHPHRWARVLGGHARKKLLWLTLGAYAQDLDALKLQLQAIGSPEVTAPARAAGDDGNAAPAGFWIQSPDGYPVQIRVADKCSPSAPAAPAPFRPTGAGQPAVGRAPARSQVQQVHPLYLSHILLFSPDVDRALRFYGEGLGLRLSDRSGSIIAFMHTPHGSDHHLIALAKSDGPGLHHSSWCVPSIDDVGLGMEQMSAAGYPDGWGVGRHVLGSNYFRYVKDPWGSYAEYSYDIDHIAAGTVWPAGDHPPEDSLYVWGPAVPSDFVVNREWAGCPELT